MKLYIRPDFVRQGPESLWTEVAPGCWAKRVPDDALPEPSWIDEARHEVDVSLAQIAKRYPNSMEIRDGKLCPKRKEDPT